ncbi:MAG TPA: hypothetical protein VMT53_03640 [Terriglobales bacterium]|nr:hypothetical protein [Terriglobales bacterium]
MNELIGKLLAAIPAYARQLIQLLRSPREFIRKLELDSDSALQDALTFLAVSFALAFIAQIPLLPGKANPGILFGASAVIAGLAFLAEVALLALSWKVVGGRLPFRKFLIVNSYFTGFSSLMFLMAELIAIGVCQVLDPAITHAVFYGPMPDPVDAVRSEGVKALFLVLALGIVAVYVWAFVVWRSYRELNRVSKFRSAIAFVVFLGFSPMVLALQLLMGASLSPTTVTPFPTELVGVWETPPPAGPFFPLFPVGAAYSFDSQGYYDSVDSKAVSNGDCVTTTVDTEWGHATVEGSTLTLHPFRGSESIDGSCPGKRTEAIKNLTNVEFRFTLRQSSEGQQLCLMGRYGERCLTPRRR